MLEKAFRSLCVSCGEECGYNKILCIGCVKALPRPRFFCGGCGYPLAVPAVHCSRCDEAESGIDHYYADYLYTGAMRDIIRRIKYNWRWRGTDQLGELCEAAQLKADGYDRAVPVPFHFLRRFARFVQPVSIIAKSFESRGFICDKILVRTVHTEYQAKLSRSERKINVKGVFEVSKDVSGMCILLIDDIFTTGATVAEAAKTLKKHGAAKVDVYTLLTGGHR